MSLALPQEQHPAVTHNSDSDSGGIMQLLPAALHPAQYPQCWHHMTARQVPPAAASPLDTAAAVVASF